MSIAPFLSLFEPTGEFARIRDDTLIQHGGWFLIAFAVSIAANGYYLVHGNKRRARWVLIIGCVAAALVIAGNTANKGLRTIYPVGFDGTVDISQLGMVGQGVGKVVE